ITFVISNLLFLCLSIYYLINTSVLECYYEISQLSFLRKVTYLWNIPFKTLLWCSRQYDLPSFFIHKTYNSLNLLIASVFVISLIFKTGKNYLIKIVLLLVLILFSLYIFYMKSLVGLALLFTIIPFFLLYNLVGSKKAFITIVLLVSITLPY